jgi:hypothetical protein
MMGWQTGNQRQLFYLFNLERRIPASHLLRRINPIVMQVLADLREKLAPFYSDIGRPSIDPELMIRMLIVGYCYGIRFERRLCEEVELHLAYRWFCRLDLDGSSIVSAKTLPEFIAYAKANPGKLTWASPGVGTAGHVCGELFKMMAGLNMVHVPYRGGGAAMADLLSGQLQVYIGAMTSSLEYVKASRLRALAVSTATRSEALPEVARVSDFVPGFETSDWGGVSAPKSTPSDLVDKLNKEINTALADPNFKARLADLGAAPFPGSPAQFGTFIAEETEKWAKVVKFAGIKAE